MTEGREGHKGVKKKTELRNKRRGKEIMIKWHNKRSDSGREVQ